MRHKRQRSARSGSLPSPYSLGARTDPSPEASAPLKCVWMLAGVVDYKLCDHNYECEQCAFDRAIRERAVQQATSVREIRTRSGEIMCVRPPDQKSLTERIPTCPLCREYPAGHEPHSDQSTTWGLFHIARNLFYHPAHIWARIERRGLVRIGVDDFGQKLLGRIYWVRLPEVGARVLEGDPCGVLIHQAGEIALSAPVTGVVHQLNERLRQQPSLINHDPYGEGWVLLLRPERLQQDVRHLFYGEHAFRWYQREIERLHQEIHAAARSGETPPAMGRTLPDGGTPCAGSQDSLAWGKNSPTGLLEELLGPSGWASVIAQFLTPPARRHHVFPSAPEGKTKTRR